MKLHDIFDEKIEQNLDDEDTNVNKKPPVLFGKCNRWRGQKMISLISYLRLWVKKYPNFDP